MVERGVTNGRGCGPDRRLSRPAAVVSRQSNDTVSQHLAGRHRRSRPSPACLVREKIAEHISGAPRVEGGVVLDGQADRGHEIVMRTSPERAVFVVGVLVDLDLVIDQLVSHRLGFGMGAR